MLHLYGNKSFVEKFSTKSTVAQEHIYHDQTVRWRQLCRERGSTNAKLCMST